MRWCIARERKDAPVFQRDGHKFPLTDLVRSTFIIICHHLYLSYTFIHYTGWWFGTCFIFPFFLGMSSSQLLLTPSFFRGVGQQPTTICWVKSVKSTTSPCWSHQRPSGVKPGRINLCSWEDKCRAPGKPTYTKRLKEVVDVRHSDFLTTFACGNHMKQYETHGFVWNWSYTVIPCDPHLQIFTK